MSKPTAVGGYIFAGGFTLGMSERFHVLGHLEDGEFGVKTFRLNFPEVPVFTAVDRWPINDLRGRVDAVYTNPPCAPFSNLTQGGYFSGGKDFSIRARMDEYEDRYTQGAVDLLKSIEPRVWVLECVTGLVTRGEHWLKRIVAVARERGYQTSIVLHDGKFMGLPQCRRRVFVVAHNVGINWTAPTTTITTVGMALVDIDDPGQTRPILRAEVHEKFLAVAKQYPKLRGVREVLLEHYGTAMGVSFQVRILDWHRPSPVLTKSGFMYNIHPDRERCIGLNEALRLSGYPVGYKWSGGPGVMALETSKTVTPPVARWLAHQLGDALEAPEGQTPLMAREVLLVNFMAEGPRLDDPRMINSQQIVTDKYTQEA